MTLVKVTQSGAPLDLREVDDYLRKSLQRVLNKAREAFPVYRGNLRQSWRIDYRQTGQGNEVEAVISGAEYATWLEYGFKASQFSEYMAGRKASDLKQWFEEKLGVPEDVAFGAAASTIKQWREFGREPGFYLKIEEVDDILEFANS